MKYLRHINESVINYKEELTNLYSDIFKQVFEQNKYLKDEIDYIGDLYLEIFDEIGIYPQPVLKIYFYNFDAKSMSDFHLRISNLDLDNVIDDYEEDYNYVISTLSENKDVYLFIEYEFPAKDRKRSSSIVDKLSDDVDRRLNLIDFEPNYFSSLFGDENLNSIGCYKEIKLDYAFNYLKKFPEGLRSDIKKFITDNKLSNKTIDDLAKLISKLSTNN